MDDQQKPERIQTIPGQLPVNQETLDILVANIIPTSKYFEARFDHLEHRVIKIEEDLGEFRRDVSRRFNEMGDAVNLRFEQVDKRFEQVDKRFEQVDKRFEQVDKRFEQIIHSIDRLSDNLEHRDQSQRSFTMRMFSVAIAISFVGVLGVFLKLLN